MNRYIKTILLAFFLVFSLNTVHAETVEPVSSILAGEEESVQPNRPFWVVTHLKLKDHWHAYWKNPGDAGMAPSIEWTLPPGFRADETQFPYPQRFSTGEMVGFGYENEVLLLTKITPPQTLDSASIEIGAALNWVVCSDDTCLPGDANVSLSLPVKTDIPDLNGRTTALFARARANIPQETAELSAEHQKDQISLLVPHDERHLSVSYFPDVDHNLDIKSKVSIEPHPTIPNHHIVKLPVTAGAAQAERLKGVLVLQGKGEKQAYNVDIPVKQMEVAAPKGIIETTATEPAQAVPLAPEFEGGMALALLFAFVGGMILNLMPCVLPVMSFKVLGFVKMAGQSRSLTLKHGILFSLGVLISFWTLASLLIALQSYGQAVGWGFQLQEPLFVASLAAVLLVFGLSLFGVFELGTSIASKAGQAAHTATMGGASQLAGSFMSGVLATAVATPCTGPFLGTALGYAVTQPPFFSLLIFTFIGIGMAFPYLLLAGYPNLLRFMPKPGPWMETFKEIMGFLMLATVLWLIWVFSAQTNYMAVTMLLGAFFVMAIGCWIYGKWATPLKKRATRIASTVITACCFLLGADIVYTSTTPWVEAMGGGSQQVSAGDSWENFSQARIDELQKKGVPVFVDFTAKWCLICQTNHMVLSTNSVSEALNKKGVVKMKADWTKRDPAITDALSKFGRNGVPLYVLYSGDPKQSPEILPQVLTPDIVIDSVKKDTVKIANVH